MAFALNLFCTNLPMCSRNLGIVANLNAFSNQKKHSNTLGKSHNVCSISTVHALKSFIALSLYYGYTVQVEVLKSSGTLAAV